MICTMTFNELCGNCVINEFTSNRIVQPNESEKKRKKEKSLNYHKIVNIYVLKRIH